MSDGISGIWNFPTRVWFGPGTIRRLAKACGQLGMARPLLVTDEGLRDLPIVETALAVLREGGLEAELFADVRGNPIGENVEAGVQAFHAHAADGVVAFGGGSGLDVGKAVAFMAGQAAPIWEFEDKGSNWTRANAAAIAPIVAVPTTAGTGSEVGRASVIANGATHEKKIIFHPKMLPGLVISDPELTVGLPPGVTAATGLDAFVHCFEAYCAPGFHPMADGVALEGMRRIARALPRAVADGADIDARADMLAAASMGATAFQKGLGGVHAISHSVGAVYDTHHGLTNAIVLPYVMRANETAIADRMDLLARVLDLPGRDFASVLDYVLRLRTELSIPDTLAALDVPADDAERIGAMAETDPAAGGNPIRFDAAAYARLFEASVTGAETTS